MRVFALALLIAVLPWTAGCDDGDPDGSWALVRVDGDQLPVVEGSFALMSGSVEIREDSLIETDAVVFGYGTQQPQEIEIRNAVSYVAEGSTVRALPEDVSIPGDQFQQCSTGGVYRLEDGGRTLRKIGLVSVGECPIFIEPYPTRIYRRR